MKRLVVFEFRMMGDAIMSIPFIRSAQKTRDVYVCCSTGSTPIFEHILPKDHIFEWIPPWLDERKKYSLIRWMNSGFRKWIRIVRSLNADEVVCAWADARVHSLMLRSHIPTRISFAMNEKNYLGVHDPRRRRKLRAGRRIIRILGFIARFPLLTTSIDRTEYHQHHVEDWRQIADVMNFQWLEHTPWLLPCGAMNSALEDQLAPLLKAAKDRGVPIWILHPGARLASKKWGLEAFEQCIDAVFNQNNIPLIIIDPPEGGAPEPMSAIQVKIKTEKFSDLVHVINIADAVLCNDSLASHLGAALDKPVVCVFGSGDPRWFAPWGDKHQVISIPNCKFHPCLEQCLRERCVCIEDIPSEIVIKRILSVNNSLC